MQNLISIPWFPQIVQDGVHRRRSLCLGTSFEQTRVDDDRNSEAPCVAESWKAVLENNIWTSDTIGGLEDQPHPIEVLYTSRDDEIGDAKDAFLDSQENLIERDFVGCPSSCDEISDESFSDREVGEDPDEELHEMLGWPMELLHAPD